MNEDLKDRLLERTRRMLDATVDEVMTREVMTVDAGDLAAKAARYILENGFLGLLVMKDGRPQNMVTAFELLRLSYEEVFDENRDFMRMKIGDLIADKEFVSVRSGTRLRDVLNLMCDRHVRSVPVIDEGLVRGIVSMPDLVRWYRDTHDEVRTGKL
ncbi:MAG: CBS domain-containing protein [Leptospiraceae bacterium]|nr:CBS domain-containing protein [Leptospiraceae bacterium]